MTVWKFAIQRSPQMHYLALAMEPPPVLRGLSRHDVFFMVGSRCADAERK